MSKRKTLALAHGEAPHTTRMADAIAKAQSSPSKPLSKPVPTQPPISASKPPPEAPTAPAQNLAAAGDEDCERLIALGVGDVVELPGLMLGLLPTEPVIATVVMAASDRMEVDFKLLYCGVKLGHRTLTKNKDGGFAWA
jgi:hypothetical protein